MILLDTCTLLWLVADAPELSSRARDLLARHRGEIFVSAISAFEIGVKQRKGALSLPLDVGAWYEGALDFHGIREIPVTGSIAAASTALPALHRDPCDRIIVATAKAHRLAILTPDEHIGAYPDTRTTW